MAFWKLSSFDLPVLYVPKVIILLLSATLTLQRSASDWAKEAEARLAAGQVTVANPIVLHDIARYCTILHDIARYCTILHARLSFRESRQTKWDARDWQVKCECLLPWTKEMFLRIKYCKITWKWCKIQTKCLPWSLFGFRFCRTLNGMKFTMRRAAAWLLMWDSQPLQADVLWQPKLPK